MNTVVQISCDALRTVEVRHYEPDPANHLREFFVIQIVTDKGVVDMYLAPEQLDALMTRAGQVWQDTYPIKDGLADRDHTQPADASAPAGSHKPAQENSYPGGWKTEAEFAYNDRAGWSAWKKGQAATYARGVHAAIGLPQPCNTAPMADGTDAQQGGCIDPACHGRCGEPFAPTKLPDGTDLLAIDD